MIPGRDLLYLSEADIAGLGLIAGAIADALAPIHAARGAGRAEIPPQVILKQKDGADFYALTACVEGSASGVKWLGNTKTPGLPSFMGLIVVSDSVTGAPVAVLSASALTAVRTAATTLLAARHLARPASTTIGFVGCGAQALAHLSAIAEEFPAATVLLAGRGKAGIAAMTDLAGSLGLAAEAAAADAVLERSDIVVTSVPPSAVSGPFLDANRLSAGAFLAAVDHGASLHPAGLARLDRLFTDDRAATAARAAVDPHLGEMDFAGDLAGIGDGFRRMSETERLGFVFAGTALADLAASLAVVDAARNRKVGRLLPL